MTQPYRKAAYRAAILDPQPVLYSVAEVARMTNRSPDVIRRYVRNGTVAVTPDPSDGRAHLIPAEEIPNILRRPRQDGRVKLVQLTRQSDGYTYWRLVNDE
jgi:hypothetical protein